MIGSKPPAKIRRKQEQFKTMNVGCPKRWTQSQQEAIDTLLPEWHQFSLVKHGSEDGRSPKLLDWKKKKANELLASSSFKDLPAGVSVFFFFFVLHANSSQMDTKEARKIIIRKYTNYRNREQERLVSGVTDRKYMRALEEAAAALVDYKVISKGKSLFKRERHESIIRRRDEIFLAHTNNVSMDVDDDDDEGSSDGQHQPLPLVACYQKALKELWEKEDQRYWDERSADEPEDIFE